MMTSVKELKGRLGEFLADPQRESEFREWFALALRDAHESGPEVEQLADEIVWAFLDQERGLRTAAELATELAEYCSM